eukprot:TRINITY_DN7451_c1_g1_i1.p2 TRINITY_DN7451_c1_g1~~TRINITY_DN7451_c1_g1_i1.p2  ORF type:complete len:335 (-),score=36.09 TRINITY_DN7451_c1_g1_i1:91-1095(-)
MDVIGYERGKAAGFHRWYDEAHELVLNGCGGKVEEMHLFMGLLAACSPNSTLQQNAVNALLNFRAVSQHARPRYGSYPNEMLVNYLGCALGAASGAKVSAFLSNLTQPETSNAVTIDTHMQQLLLGEGRQSLLAWEYAVLEDYVRALAKAVGDLPHRLQAALWCHTGASAVSYRNELLARAIDVVFPIALPGTAENTSWASHAGALIRRKLLELGYLSYPAGSPASDCVCLSVLVPLRSIEPRIAAKRQGHDLNSSAPVNVQDESWWERDRILLRRWLGCVDETVNSKTSFHQQVDPYYRTHLHFPDECEALLQTILPADGFYAELQKEFVASL